MARLFKIVIACYSTSLVVWALLWKGRLPYHVDTRLYAYPDHAYNLKSFHDGFLPLWNPYLACGVPHLANWQSACLYPPFWLFNLTGLSDWLMWMALVHAAFAFFGCYLWLKSQKAEPLWAALGALSFAGSAHLVACWANIPFIATASWIPWIFWAASERRWWLLLGSISLQVLAGYPFFTFYTLLFLIFWFESQRPSPALRWRFAGAWVGAGLLTCAQWLPFLDFLGHSWHDQWTDYPYFTKPVEYLTLLEPDVLGPLGSVLYKGSFANYPFNLYLGLVPLALLIWKISRRSASAFWTWSALFWLLWLAGQNFPLWRLFPRPLLEFLEPSKAVGLFLFCALTALCAGQVPLPWKKKTGSPWVALLSALWVLDLLSVPFRLHHPMPDPFLSEEVKKEAASIQDLLPAGRSLSLRPQGEPDFPGGDKGTELSFERPIRTFRPNSNMVWGLRSAEQYLYLQVDGSQNLTRYINKGFRDGYSGGLLDLAGVKLFLMPQVPAGEKYRTLANFGGDLLIQNSKAAEDLRWVGDKVELPSRPEVLEKLSVPGSGWEQKVYLERTAQAGLVQMEAPDQKREPAPFKGYPRPSAGRASYMEDYRTPGYVVFNETYCPGWRAWVDGASVPILRAYGLFMAVAAPPGTHQVDFRFEPASFRLGLFLTLGMLGLLGGWGLRRRLA